MALKDHNQGIFFEPKDDNSYLQRGITYEFLKNSSAAIKDYSQAIKLNAHNAEAYFNRGTLYQALNNRKKAIADLQRALDLYEKEEKLEEVQQIKKRLSILKHSQP